MKKEHILVALVENKSGVLNQITSLFRKRRFNIESFNVGRTDDPRISRMTIVVDATATNVEQVIKQLYKIISVLKVSDVTGDQIVLRETILVKVHAPAKVRAEIFPVADAFHAKIIDISVDSLIFELTATPEKSKSFLEILRPFGIKEMVRSGMTAMSRGKKK